MKRFRRLRALLRPGFAAELEEEMRLHRELQRADGMDPRAFGNELLLRERSRDAWGWTWLDRSAQDLRLGWRQMRRSPGFAALAILILALGIGANTALFSVVNAALLRPLPYPHPERIVAVWGLPLEGVPPHSFVATANYELGEVNLVGSGQPERVSAAEVSASFFPLLGIAPLGRGFLPQEQTPGPSQVVVLSEALARRLGGAAAVLGRPLSVNGRAKTVIGVMPAGFDFPARTQVWMPLPTPWNFAGENLSSDLYFIFSLARLRPGVTFAQARQELIAIVARPSGNLQQARDSIRLEPLQASLLGDTAPMLWMLLAAVGLVLLIACADIANLQLTRAIARQREVGIRAALGASRVRLLRQHLTESLLLSALGGGAGLALAAGCLPLLRGWLPATLPLAAPLAIDNRVLAFTAAAALASGLLFGLLPAWHACGLDLRQAVEGAAGAPERGWLRRARAGLAVAEVALALMLAVGAGLLLRSFDRLSAVNPGFQPGGMLTAELNLNPRDYGTMVAEARFYDRLLPRIAALPGVSGVGLSSRLPMVAGEHFMGIRIATREPSRANQDQGFTTFSYVGPGYFGVMGIPLRAGRDFTAADAVGAPGVAILDQALAEGLWPHQNPLGKHVTFGAAPGHKLEWLQVVGVVGHAALHLDAPSWPFIYRPLAQVTVGQAYLEVRAARATAALPAAIRRAVASVDPDEPVSDFALESDRVAASIAAPRFRTELLSLFAALALLLSAAGIFAVMAFWAARRTAEIGIRMALGAEPVGVLRMIVGQGMRLVGWGMLIGLAGALALGELLGHFLFQVTARDPLTLAAATAVMALAGFGACYFPARRAASLDPLVALREE